MEQKGKKLNISKNPVQAYIQGREAGAKMTHAENIRQGINLAYAYMLLAMDAANEKYDEKTFLSKPKFKEFYEATMENLQRLVAESIEGEEGIDTYDIADLYVSHDTRTRKKYGMPLKNYDGKDEVL